MKTADEQFMFAVESPTNREAWLKSVAKYFPRDHESIAKANQELGFPTCRWIVNGRR